MSKLSDAIIEEMREMGILERNPMLAPAPATRSVAPRAPVTPKRTSAPNRPAVPKRTVAPRRPLSPKVPVSPRPASTQRPLRPGEKPPLQHEPGEPAKPATTEPTIQKAQYQIFRVKNRMSKLAIKTEVKKFLNALHDFDINITKNSTDLSKIEAFAAPLSGDAQSLGGTMDALKIELEKLIDIIQGEK